MRHLCLVSQRGAETGMTAKNLAIVWAPNLLRRREDANNNSSSNNNVGGNLRDVALQAACTEFLIRYCQVLFSEEFPSEAVDRLVGEAGFELGIEHRGRESKEVDIDQAIAAKATSGSKKASSSALSQRVVTFADEEEVKEEKTNKRPSVTRPHHLHHQRNRKFPLERSKSSVTSNSLGNIFLSGDSERKANTSTKASSDSKFAISISIQLYKRLSVRVSRFFFENRFFHQFFYQIQFHLKRC